MPDRPSQPGCPPVPDDLASLAARYPGWQLSVTSYGYAAEHTSASGRSIRYIAAHTVEDLAASLATAEVVEP
ncbi:MAG: hypothetical protein ACLPN6_25375 [Streptosporangiaceae bacterium]|jgi:hypothetical protein